MVTVESVEYAGWEDCVRVTNGTIELVCTTSVGPRIVHASREGAPNCCHLADDAGERPDDGDWHVFGGHRLWHAPEREDRTAQPDNDPVAIERHDDGVTLTQPTEAATDLRKSLTVRVEPDEPRATVTHTIRNEGCWTIEVAPWAITVCEPGGTAILPMAQRGDDRTADRSVSLWPYTDCSDDRLEFAHDAVLVEGAEQDFDECKIGVDGGDGWAAYAVDDQVLRKEFVRVPSVDYADRGAAAQVYTNGDMLELETLGPLESVDPGASTTHTEEWTLLEGVDVEDSVAAVEELRP